MALRQCPECGKMISEKAEQCPKCGADLSQVVSSSSNGATSAPETPKQNGNSRLTLILSIIGAVAIAVAIAAWLYFSKNTENERVEEPENTTYSDISSFPSSLYVAMNNKKISRHFRNTDTSEEWWFDYSSTSASVEWPEKINSVDISPLCDSIINMLTKNRVSTIDEALIDFADNPQCIEYGTLEPIDSITGSGKELSTAVNISFEMLTPKLAVIKGEYEEYGGGAHGSYWTNYMIFSLTDNVARHLSFSDIFLPNSSQELLEEITRQIRYDDIPVDQDLFVSDEIWMTKYEIVFHYGIYSIGPYALGEVDVKVPICRIRSLLTPVALALIDE